MLGLANILWYLFIFWLCAICPPLGVGLLVLSLYGDLKN